MRNFEIKILTATIIATVVAGTAVAGKTAYDAAVPEGFFWYRDHPKEAPKPKQQPQQQTPTAPQQPAETKPEAGSAEWFRKKETELKDLMTSKPTPQNVFAYQTVNRMMQDRADEVARVWESNVKQHPFLSEDVRMPFSAHARQQALWKIDQAKEKIMADIAAKAGLWMFFDSTCNHCHSQFQTVSLLKQKYKNLEVHYISTDGGIIKGMPANKIRYDKGGIKARSLGIQITPAVVLVAPPDQMGIIAHGAMSRSDLEEKIVTAAIDMKIADPKLAQTAQMNESGMVNHNDWQAAGITGNETTEELARKIYGLIGKKMGR